MAIEWVDLIFFVLTTFQVCYQGVEQQKSKKKSWNLILKSRLHDSELCNRRFAAPLFQTLDGCCAEEILRFFLFRTFQISLKGAHEKTNQRKWPQRWIRIKKPPLHDSDPGTLPFGESLFWTLGGFCLAEIWRFFVFRTFQMCCKGILMKVYCIDLQPQCSVAPMDMAEWKHQNRLTWPTFIGDCLKVHFKAYFPTENIVVLIWSGWNLSCAVELYM